MYRNIAYNNKSRIITLWCWDEDGNRVERQIPYKPYIHIEQKDAKDAISIFKTPLKKREFECEFDRKRFVETSGIRRIFSNLPVEQQFLIDTYGDIQDQKSFTENPLRTFFLDIEVFSPDEFPHAKDAKHPINLITIFDSLVGKYHTWGVHAYATPCEDIIYHKCVDESDLLRSFMKYWKKNYPDIVSGWNCLNMNERVWSPDKISKLSNLSKNTQLFMSDYVKDYKKTGLKEEYCIQTALGNKIYPSINHKFPVYIKNSNKYKNFNTLTKSMTDMKVSEIIDNMENNDLYLRLEKRVNNNKNLTYRDFICEIININDDIDIIIDNIDFKNKIKKLGLCSDLRCEYYQGTAFWKRCPSFWHHKNIQDIYADFDINSYIKSVDHLYIKQRNGNPFRIELDNEIDLDLIRLAGFIFTDGTYSKSEKSFGLSSRYEYIAQHYTNIASKISGRELSPPYRSKKADNFYKKISANSHIGLIYDFIYKSDRKKINVELLSLLSKEQFSSFFSGLIDGDGFCDNNGLNLCNFDTGYQDNLHNLQELLLWNNTQSSVHKNVLRISASNYNKKFIKDLSVIHKPRQDKLSNFIYKNKNNSISKDIKFFEVDDHILVKISKIEKTGNLVEMADIETGTHYFTCNGIKTHNCDGFDIPYIVNRINRLFGEDFANALSPVDRIWSQEKLNRHNIMVTEWNIQGISCIDYIKAYRKFSKNERESYTLDYIGEYEGVGGKIDYEGTLAQLSIKDWMKFVDYNIRDVEVVKRLEEKLHYLDLCRMISYKGLTKFEKALGTTSVVAGAFALEARRRGMIVPTFKYDKERRPAGGLVHIPDAGFKDDVVSFDAASLYPNTIISLNLSPETKIGQCVSDENYTTIRTVRGKEFRLRNTEFKEWMIKNKVCKSIHGTLFSQQEKGIIPRILEGIYAERKAAKDHGKRLERKIGKLKNNDAERNKLKRESEELDVYQYTLKILMNSMYGTFGNSHSILYDVDLSDSITLTGQEVNRQSVLAVQNLIKEKYGSTDNLSIYGDTDSIYITITPILNRLGIKLLEDEERVEGKSYKITDAAMQIITEIGGEENPKNGAISSHLSKWALKEMNSLDPRFEFKREKVSKCGLFLDNKKRYALQVVDNEGVPVQIGSKKEFSIVGIEGIVTSTHAKEIQKINKDIVISMLITRDENKCNDAVLNSYKEFCKLTPEILGTRKSVKDLNKYASKANGFEVALGTPQNSKASILYNNLLKHLNLDSKYERITSGDKIKIIYLSKNRFGLKYIGFKKVFPPEFLLEADYKLLYLTNSYPVIERLYHAVGWSPINPTKDYACDLLSEFC